MSNQTGFDYDVMISRLYGGVRAFQSLRTHRRERHREEAPARAPEPVTTPPPQPVNGAFDVPQPPCTPSPVREPVPEAPQPQPQFVPPTLQTEPAPQPAGVSPLKLPLPTPPARLSLILGTPPAPTSETQRAAPTVDAATAAAPGDPSLEALRPAGANDEAARLEQIFAEHRGCVAQLLREHRAELDVRAQAEAARAQADAARAEAHAARTAQGFCELLAQHRAELDARAEAEAMRTTLLLAEHRAELARGAASHAAELACVLAQHRETPRVDDGHGASLREALAEHVSLQREAHEEVAQHITLLTTIVADLGQTVGVLAVATYEGKQGHLPPLPPPPMLAPAPRPASPDARAPSQPPPPPPTSAPPSTHAASPVPRESPAAAHADAATSCVPADPPHAANDRAGGLTPEGHLRAVAAADERARVDQFLDDVRDDDEFLQGAPDDDDAGHTARLGSVTPCNGEARTDA